MCKADSGCSRAVQAPGGAVLAHCPDGGRKDVRNAVDAALKVQPGYDFRSTSVCDTKHSELQRILNLTLRNLCRFLAGG